MRVFASSGNPSQKPVLGQKAMIRSFVASKLKKKNNLESIESKVLFKGGFTHENLLCCTPEKEKGILQASKKIKKEKETSVLVKKTKKEHSHNKEHDEVPAPIRILRSGKVFLEDGTKQTKNYETISHIEEKSKKNYSFLCFPDWDLAVPVSYASKIPKHTVDNDCSTDEEQIEDAINDIFASLKISIEEQKLEKSFKKKYQK